MIHIYSGDGKGKTTAVVGLAVRAAGAGMRVYFYQFLKNGSSSEISMLESLRGVTVRCCRNCSKFTSQLNDEEKAAVTAEQNSMLIEIKNLINSHGADLIIIDEFIDAYNKQLVDRLFAEVMLKEFPSGMELAMTGREPTPFLCRLADYHSEIKAVKHPFENGMRSRRGIEY